MNNQDAPFLPIRTYISEYIYKPFGYMTQNSYENGNTK